MNLTLEVFFTPADFSALARRDLSKTVCVVFDVLRATTSMINALANGAEAIVPVETISEALALRQSRTGVLLAGEREGLRIRAAQTGSVDFDLGNSPREFTPDRVRGETIVMSTTNGTLALKACMGARHAFAGSFLNLSATVRRLEAESFEHLAVVCAGTFEQAAYEDILAAGALCQRVWSRFPESGVADSAQVARQIYELGEQDLIGALSRARNARRLLTRPELAGDVAFSVQRDIFDFAATLQEGAVKKTNG